jgi:hypothetical protein
MSAASLKERLVWSLATVMLGGTTAANFKP